MTVVNGGDGKLASTIMAVPRGPSEITRGHAMVGSNFKLIKASSHRGPQESMVVARC